jgi:hypothetical protein
LFDDVVGLGRMCRAQALRDAVIEVRLHTQDSGQPRNEIILVGHLIYLSPSSKASNPTNTPPLNSPNREEGISRSALLLYPSPSDGGGKEGVTE